METDLLRKLMEQQNIAFFADIQFGSIYSSLKRMAAEGLVTEESVTEITNRPPRTIFSITRAGRARLRAAIRDTFRNVAQPERPLDMAVHFSGLLRVGDLQVLIGERLERLREFEQVINEAEAATVSDKPGVSALVSDVSEHFRLVVEAERRWAERLAERFASGGYGV